MISVTAFNKFYNKLCNKLGRLNNFLLAKPAGQAHEFYANFFNSPSFERYKPRVSVYTRRTSVYKRWGESLGGKWKKCRDYFPRLLAREASGQPH